jgi:short-subunit dehydrogenase
MELEDQGVVVSCLSPGPSDTGFFSDLDRRGIAIDAFAKGEAPVSAGRGRGGAGAPVCEQALQH